MKGEKGRYVVVAGEVGFKENLDSFLEGIGGLRINWNGENLPDRSCCCCI